MPSPYTRVSITGSRRNVDSLLPSDTPVGALLPQILDMLQDRPEEGLGAKVLVRGSGEPVDPTLTLEQAQVLDGERLSLVSETEAPPTPIVYDLNDAVTDATEGERGRWSPTYRLVISGIIAALGAWIAGRELISLLVPEGGAWVCLGLAAALLVGGAVVSAPGRQRAVAGTLIGAGTLFALSGLWRLGLPWEWHLVAWGALAAVVMGLLGFVVRTPLALFIAAAVTGGLTAVWALSPVVAEWAIGDRGHQVVVGAAGIAGILTVLVLGLLPQIALGLSGLASLDDGHAQDGRSILRTDAARAIAGAHGSLVTASIVCALSAAAALSLLAQDTSHHPYSLSLTAVLTVAVGLRARTFPLASERIPLYLAAGVGAVSVVRLAIAFVPQAEIAWWSVLLVLALVFGSALSRDLPDHTQARLRRAGDTLEAICLVAAVPLLIGYFGIFASLLEVF